MSIKRETVAERKALPLASGVLDYFPDALLVVAEVSRVGNEQHHPGEPLHWDKSKSSDEADALLRHLLDRGTYDTDGLRHSGKVAWRALAMLQRELDAEAAKPVTFSDDPNMQRGLDGIVSHEVVTEDWGTGNGDVYGMTGSGWHAYGHMDYRGDWPPDTRLSTRVNGLLTCCGQSEHPIDCAQYRA